jgi:hypothetical protein
MTQKEQQTRSSSAVHTALIFFSGVLSTITVVVLVFTLAPDNNMATIPNVYSSSTECEVITGEACFLRDCTPEVCPANFEKGWMPQSVVAQLEPTPEKEEITDTSPEAQPQSETSVPETLSTESACASSDACNGGVCISGLCHRTCTVSEDCSSLYEEGECTEEGYCSLPMISEQ